MELIKITEQNYPEVAKIYLEGIATGNATFQTTAPGWKHWDESHLKVCRILVIETGQYLGWAALTSVSSRCVYEGVAEISVYVSEMARGKGIGKLLLHELIKLSEENNIWTLQASVFPENISSIKLHEACGFRVIGYREKIGNMKGLWRDNMILERRSKTVGI